MGVPFRAVVADCAYGDNVNFEAGLWEAGLPYVVSLKPAKGTWAMADQAHTPEQAARRLRWRDPAHPDDWTPVERGFRDGHTQTWYVADLTFSGYGPERLVRLVVATTEPATLPAISTWYLATNLPCPGSGPAADSPHAPADLTEVVRLDGLRKWVEQGYQQVKQELGWADFMVRSDRAIRRHWPLICCAFSCCWRTWSHAPPASESAVAPAHTDTTAGRGERCAAHPRPAHPCWPVALRRVRGWLDPWTFLRRCRQAWAGPAPPPPDLQLLLNAVAAGRPLYLYLPE